MKLAKFRDRDVADRWGRWGLVDTDAGTIRAVGGPFEQWAPTIAAAGADASLELGEPVPMDSVKLLAPIGPATEITGTGVNYPEWAIPFEGADVPYYFKPLLSIIGPDDEIKFGQFPKWQPECRTCYEIELVVVMAAPVADINNCMASVLGYSVGNDTCLRNQYPNFLGMDLVGSKSSYHATGIGPWVTTKDEVGGDANPDLDMIMRVNGTITQHSRTSEMNWPIERVLREANYRYRLQAGDIVFTGTPGFVDIPDGFYEPNDVIEAEIEGIGVLRNTVEPTNPYGQAPLVPSGAEMIWAAKHQGDA